MVAVVAAVAIWLAIGGFVSVAGRAWGSNAVLERREQLEGVAGRELDRRIGRPLRDALRERASLGAAMTEFELARSAIDD